jgi:hypothetical protein
MTEPDQADQSGQAEEHKPGLVRWLGYSGLLPFIIAAVLSLFGIAGALAFFLAYSAMILAFMAGASWGVGQGHHQRMGYWLPGVSIAVFLWGLAAWVLVAIIGSEFTLIALVAGYLVLYLMELQPLFREVYSPVYRRLRRHLTLVVVVVHLLLIGVAEISQ